ncbi:hypothetical protein [Marinicella sp. W31]|uniref:chorismate transformation enzyme, FkbO/Hyg5 family n=1 Tax=Marinicella sp. W31 TaxID=3023713 RepID=UPI003757B0C5
MENSQLTVTSVPVSHLKLFFGFNVQSSEHELNIPLELLATSDGYAEYWLTGEDVQCEQISAGESLVQTDEHVLITIKGEEAQVAEQTAYSYRRAYEISQQLQMPHLIRAWNYFPDINWQVSGLENYQQFCVSRYETLNKLDKHRAPYPAATAIGSKNKQYAYIFFFSKKTAQVIENSRQVSAWDYPSMYSPKQPVFSRAVQFQKLLICSGTASVVGHKTLHENDFELQFTEMLKNIQVLIDTSAFDYPLKDGYYKFYLRDRAQLPLLLSLIDKYGLKKFMVFEGDICRESLLLESEAVFA